MNASKLTVGLLAAAIALGAGTAYGAGSAPILLNYKNLGLSEKAKVSAGVTWVPLKALAADMGYSVVWNPSAKMVVLTRPDRQITLTAGSQEAKVNGAAVKLAQPFRNDAGVLSVPLVGGVVLLGGKMWRDPASGNLNILDETRYVTAAASGAVYWVSQQSGEVYVSNGGAPKLAGKLPVKASSYMHGLEVQRLSGAANLLTLSDNHYAMFTNFSNVYQAVIQGGVITLQKDYHLSMPAYDWKPAVPSTQTFLRDGGSVQYLGKDGAPGKAYDILGLTGSTGQFTVEYAAPDALVVRLVDNAHLYLIDPSTDKTVNLTKELTEPEDWRDWEHSDGRDMYVQQRMLTLKKREGDVLTFTYGSFIKDTVRTVTYKLK
ncbi:copper amine oxidase N-terminal domain-containing protein [Paenibacillus sp. HN-1]|uniref:copper amine oxidase N-terminal domain-containing protein n=1 Tax=Paenibacillus TaxID=44249 RepID=UPI001CA819D3|nr:MULTISPECIES: copper amine oxidase N-terminal domain-containing protein [Paenibacillus]MBY9077864.1 copper amine oxidase N-terminal domain-containing protein [Paenibacillus sp. CGMCC 1.18879]MBY9088180.1 copper amine oxidase N-terminal domain-containing protein [Paenibacillus sinensis]